MTTTKFITHIIRVTKEEKAGSGGRIKKSKVLGWPKVYMFFLYNKRHFSFSSITIYLDILSLLAISQVVKH